MNLTKGLALRKLDKHDLSIHKQYENAYVFNKKWCGEGRVGANIGSL